MDNLKSALDNLYVFPGPCKTGTTTLYKYLKGHPQVYCFGGKEFYGYKTTKGRQKIREKILKNEFKSYVIFDHNALFEEKDMQCLQQLGAQPIIIFRDCYRQSVSRLMHDVRVGVHTIESLERISNIEELDERIIGRSDYEKWMGNLPVELLENLKVLDFKGFNDLSIYSELTVHMGLSIHAPPSRQSNKNKMGRFPKLLFLMRSYFRPFLFRVGLGSLWSTLKGSRVASLLYTESGLDVVRKHCESVIDKSRLDEMTEKARKRFI